MKKSFFFLLIIFISFSGHAFCQSALDRYDMRSNLSPKRLTIAMWDFSYLFMHHTNGCYENFQRSIDELIERKFNTIRIDAFPLIIASLDSLNQSITFPANPEYNWGQTDQAYKHKIAKELIEFLSIAKKKHLNIILSTWNMDCVEFPNIKNKFSDQKKYQGAWEKVLDMLKDNDLLDNVLYVDLDQEFPYFSPFGKSIDSLKNTCKNIEDEITNSRKLKWNVKTNGLCLRAHGFFTSLLPNQISGITIYLFTYGFLNEIRYMKLKSMDVLELHVWLTQSARFLSRSQFDNMNKIRNADTNYSEYMQRVTKSFKSMKPMFKKEMSNRMKFAKEWSEEIAAPLVTTEAWGAMVAYG